MWVLKKNKINNLTIDNLSFKDLIIVTKHISSKNYYVVLNTPTNSGRYNNIVIEDDEVEMNEYLLSNDPIYSKKVFYGDVLDFKRGEYSVWILENVYNDIEDVIVNIEDIISRCESMSQDLMYRDFIDIYPTWMVVKD